MAVLTINQELNGIEISFEKKPKSETLTALKAAGFRWHRTKKIWYAKQTAERMTLAETLTGTEKSEIGTDQAALKELYRQIISEYWKDSKMIDFCMKKAAYIVQLENGDITEIEKPEIETRFCFGYGCNGISAEGDYEAAAEMMNYADTHEDYFIKENLKEINNYIDSLKDSSLRVYKFVHYCGNCDHRLKGIQFYRYYEAPEKNLKDCHELTAGERESILAGYEEVKKQFIKRLNTYLKKYGLTKLHTWTYLSD